MGAIYLITNTVNGKRYVGQTRARSPLTRWRQHKNAASAGIGYKQTTITLALRKYGSDKFEFSVIETCGNDDLDQRERFWISELGSLTPRGYNRTVGGNAGPVHPDVALKISASKRGQQFTDAHRARLSEARRRVKDAQETIEKRAAAIRGKERPIEVRARISASSVGKTLSAETRAKISEANRRRVQPKRSPEHIAAMQAGRARAKLKREQRWPSTHIRTDQEDGKLQS